MDIAAGWSLKGFGLDTRIGADDRLAASGQRRERVRDASGALVMTLAHWRVASLRTRGPAEIRCLSGQLWITEHGKLEDVVIQAGQSHAVDGPARDILLSTVGAGHPARFEILAGGRTAGVNTPQGPADFKLEFA